MPMIRHNPPSLSKPVGNYVHGIEVQPKRTLYISGQIPENKEGMVPQGFEVQCEQVWKNIAEILASANMSFSNLVKVTTFLTHPDQADKNGEIRRRVLGEVSPTLSVVVVNTLISAWLLEIEAIAVAE
jgi:2-iminobutanoate/2-iminopropanoate deaminase